MRYHNITSEDMNNGDGLRTVLWLAGCEHHCPGCQNQVTWEREGGIPFDEAAKEELMDSLSHDYISGITFSGGDPLASYNRQGVLELMKEIREKYPEKTIWLYTGYTVEQLEKQAKKNKDPWIAEILETIDVLVDGKYVQDKRDVSLMWRGSANQRVIDMKQSALRKEVVLHCK